MFKNFYVLHRGGRTYYSKNFQGDILDQSLIMGFSSSISSFCKTLLGEEVREVTSLNGRIVYKEIGDFIFVAHSDLKIGSSIIQAILADVVAICELLFGSFQYWDQDTFDLSGAQDIINTYFAQATHDPTVSVGGLSQVSFPPIWFTLHLILGVVWIADETASNKIFIEADISDRVDKLLAFLESQEGVCGNGTMLVLGKSVLHSRMPLTETRMILQYHNARGLGGASVRFTPIYSSNAWHNLYSIRINSYVLFVMCFIDKPYSLIEKRVEEFQTTLIQSRLEIPTEEPPVLLRSFAKRETLAMLYSNIKTGLTIFPALRPGPDVQQKEILGAFWAFFSDASTALRISGVTEFSMCRDSYRFYARCEGIHKLFVLLTNDSSSVDAPSIAADILKIIRNISG
eukprot:jgi/Hompol1/5234/HPOL_004264-RA